MASNETLREVPLTVLHDDQATTAASEGAGKAALAGHTVTIDRPRQQVYAFWRDFPNLAAVTENVERIDTLDRMRTRWIVKAPSERTIEWDSIVTYDEPSRLIVWQSAEGSEIRSSGRVEFAEASPGGGTIVCAMITYDPPGSVRGEWLSKLFQSGPNAQAHRDLRRLKQILEAS